MHLRLCNLGCDPLLVYALDAVSQDVSVPVIFGLVGHLFTLNRKAERLRILELEFAVL